VQRRYYVARRRKHLLDPARTAAGLPIGRSLRGTKTVSSKLRDGGEPRSRR
jgi:hypothetical protein